MRSRRLFSKMHLLVASLMMFALGTFPSILANAATIPLFKTFQKGSIVNGVYVIASHDNPNYAVDLNANNPSRQTNVHVFKKNGTQAQQWYIGCVDSKNDIYEIRPMIAASMSYDEDGNSINATGQAGSVTTPDRNHMALDVKNGETADGTNVQIYSANGSDSQRWKIVKQSDGSYRFWAMNETGSTPFLLNIASDIQDGANIQCWHKYDGIVRTKFDLQKVDSKITIVSHKTLEPVDKSAEPIRYSRLQVNDKLQPSGSKPVIDTNLTNTKYYDLTSSNVNSKADAYIAAMQDKTKKFTVTWAQVGLYDGKPVGVRLTLDNASQTNRCNSWSDYATLNDQWEQFIGTDHYVRIAYRFAGYKTADEDFLVKLSGCDHKFEFFYTSEYSGKPNATITPIDMKYSIFTSSDMNEDGSGQEGVQAVDKYTGRAYALDVSNAFSSIEGADDVGRSGRYFYGMLPHFNGTATFNKSNNAMETSVALQFKGNGMKLRICDTAGYIGYHMEFDSFGVEPSYSFTPGFTKTVDGVKIDKAARDSFAFTAERISAPDGAETFEATNVINGDNGFYVDEKPQRARGDYIYKITEKENGGYKIASPFYLKETIALDNDDKLIGTLYSSTDGKSWALIGDSSVGANSYAYTVNNVTKTSSISLTKTPNKSKLSGDDVAAGSKIGYTFTIKNTGEQELQDIVLTDTKLATAPTIDWGTNTSHTLAPGASVTATGEYSLTSDEAKKDGPINNTATVTATDQLNRKVTSMSSATVPVKATGSVTVTKSVSPSIITDGDASIGKTLTWTITAKNTGDQTLNGVSFNDSLNGISSLAINWNGNSTGKIAPGSAATATATYKITAADVKKGTVTNTAHVTCNDTRGDALRSNDATATAQISGKTGLKLEKSVDITHIGADDATAGKKLTYTIKMTNTGNKRLTGLAISDPKVSSSTISPSSTSLDAGATATATVTYAITDADITAGKVINTATAKSYDDDGNEVDSNEGTATTTIETPKPGISVVKSSDTPQLAGSNAHAGTVITYTIDITNTGNTTITNPTITDSMAYDGNVQLKISSLSPGKTQRLTAKHTVTQAEIDSGKITNTCNTTYRQTTTTSTSTTTISATSSLAITKEVDISSIPANEAIPGKKLTYTIKVTNTGQTTVSGIALNDSLSGTKVGELSRTALAPGESSTAKATYAITANDITSGAVTNTVSATGTASNGNKVTSNIATAKTGIVTPRNQLSIVKTVDKISVTGDAAKPGTKLRYTISVTNNGNTTINSITTSDNSQAGPTTVSLDKTALATGETATGTFDYAITQADIDRGTVENTAQASGKAPDGSSVTTGKSTATTTIQGNSGLAIEKTVDKRTVTPSEAIPGTKLTYAFTVRNTGATTISNIVISDSMKSLGSIKLNKTALAPNETATGTATYQITKADIDSGFS